MTLRAIALAVLMTSGFSRVAHADPATDPAGAETLFDEGRKLMDAGKFEQACPKLEASNRLEPAVGTLLNLGECNEKRGKLASAWSNYRAAASLAMSRNDARGDFARKRADSIKYSTLTIQVLAPEPGLTVTRDGLDVAEGAWGTPIPIDSGVHVVEAKAAGKHTNTVKVTVAEGPASSNVVKIEALAADPTAPPTPIAPPPKPEQPAPVPPVESSNTGHVVGAIGMGAGVVAIGLGAFLGFKAKGKWDDAKTAHCNAQALCDDEGFQMNQDARSEGTIATVLVVAGAAVAVVGIAAFFFWPDAKPAKTGQIRLHGAGFDF